MERVVAHIDAGNDAVVNGNIMRSIIGRENVTVYCSPGIYDFGNVSPMYIGKRVELIGAELDDEGKPTSRFISRADKISASGCMFQPYGDGHAKRIAFEADVPPLAQQQTFGWHKQGPQGAIWVLDECLIMGRSFALYSWYSRDNNTPEPRDHIYLFNSIIQAARWGVLAGQGSGRLAQMIDLVGCIIDIDYEKYGPGAGGDIGDGSAGLCARGGMIRAHNTKIKVRGNPNGMDGAINTGQPGDPSGYPDPSWPVTQCFGCEFDMEPGYLDMNIQIGEGGLYSCCRTDGQPLVYSGNVDYRND